MDEKKGVVLEYIIDEYVDEDDDVEVDFDTALISSGIVDSFSMVSLKVFLEKIRVAKIVIEFCVFNLSLADDSFVAQNRFFIESFCVGLFGGRVGLSECFIGLIEEAVELFLFQIGSGADG